MTQAEQHPRVQARGTGPSRTKMNATLAMVVCFVGFQGIVPQSWDSATALGPDATRTSLSDFFTYDALSPTGTVGTSLLSPLHSLDALDPSTFHAKIAPEAEVAPEKAAEAATSGEPLSAQGIERLPAGNLFAVLGELTPTSSFGFRTSPITSEAGEFHTGQDYSAPCGTPVYAADSGTVRAVGWHPWGGGNRVEVDHGNGLITTYNHLQGISVVEGDAVKGGDPIAEVGTTGSSTGCHLHFETILDGEHVDPLRWKLFQGKHGVRKGELKDYTPGSGIATVVPAWAQSSTRSDQVAPFLESDVVPVASGPSAPSGAAGHDAREGDTIVVPRTPEKTKVPDVPKAPKPEAPAPKPEAPAPKPESPAPAPRPESPAPAPRPESPAPAPRPESPAPAPESPAPAPQSPAPAPQTPAPQTPAPQTPAPTPEAPVQTPPAPEPPVQTPPAAVPPVPEITTPSPTDPQVPPTTPADADPDTSCDTDSTVAESEAENPATPDPTAPGTDPSGGPADPTTGAEPEPGTDPTTGAELEPGTDPENDDEPSCGTPGDATDAGDPVGAPAPASDAATTTATEPSGTATIPAASDAAPAPAGQG
ncbi:peptidoglycan DD-metalloendopeptidase family protein [Arthrobacter cheniae]|nr:peptidoglycan DD-metalloendopeptidase family protein [Arthrobacter cheniae]